MKDPCALCKLEYPGCRRICILAKPYQAEVARKREQAKAERSKEVSYLTYKTAQVEHTKKKAGVK